MPEAKKKLIRGGFFVLEGLDRCGKSTQSNLLMERLRSDGFKVRMFRFPDRMTSTGKLLDAYLSQRPDDTNPRSRILNPQTLHLLFSANRWESINEIESYLRQGISVVCDRYSFSGICYSLGAANLKYSRRYRDETNNNSLLEIDPTKATLSKDSSLETPLLVDMEFCKNTEKGLVQPDAVFFIDVPPEEIKRRKGFGDELYEEDAIQTRIYDMFHSFKNLHFWIDVRGMCTTEEKKNDIVKDPSDNLKSITLTSRSQESIHEDILKAAREILDELQNNQMKAHIPRLWNLE